MLPSGVRFCRCWLWFPLVSVSPFCGGELLRELFCEDSALLVICSESLGRLWGDEDEAVVVSSSLVGIKLVSGSMILR